MFAQSLLDHLPEIALASALAWGSGLRLYAVLFLIGLSGWAGWLELPSHLTILANPLVLGASGLMTLMEFGADKLPLLDSLWDAIHTFIRVPAGAALAAAVFGFSDVSIAVEHPFSAGRSQQARTWPSPARARRSTLRQNRSATGLPPYPKTCWCPPVSGWQSRTRLRFWVRWCCLPSLQ